MPSKIPPQAAHQLSANDNGPLTGGQVKALKTAIAIMSILIVAALLAIVVRVIYLSAVKENPSGPVAAISGLVPQHRLALPAGAAVKNMSLQNNRLLVHYETPAGPGAAILDLTSGKKLSQIVISTELPADK